MHLALSDHTIVFEFVTPIFLCNSFELKMYVITAPIFL